MLKDDPSRRDLLACSASAVAALALSSRSLGSPRVFGLVVKGAEPHSQQQAAVIGLSGIMVSNGYDIAVTDANGAWELPFRPGAFVFPVKPRGWEPLANRAGIKELAIRLRDVPPEGPITFTFRPTIEPQRFSVALVADTQPQSVRELGYLRDTILPSVAQSGAAFAINHGDVVFDDASLYDRYFSLVSATGIAWHHCPGNHDMNHGPPSSRFDTWKSALGPTYYAFQIGGATFIMLNNVDPLPAAQLTPSGHDYQGWFSQEQLTFVERLLRHVPREELVVISFHIPLAGFEDPDDPAGHSGNARSLLQIISGRPNTLTLAGHTHTTEHHYLGAASGFDGPGVHHHHVLTAACGSWWSGPFDASGHPVSLSRDGTPKGFHILDIDGSRYQTRFVPVGHSGHSKLSVVLQTPDQSPDTQDEQHTAAVSTDRCVTCSDLAKSKLFINVFDGGPRTVVGCKIASHAETRLLRRLEVLRHVGADISAASTFTNHRAAVKPWVVASVSSHLWVAALPESLPPGSYSAEIAVSDEYGVQHSSSFIFEVTA